MPLTEQQKRAVRRTLDRILEQEGGMPILIVYEQGEGLCSVWTSVETAKTPGIKEEIMRLLLHPDSEEVINNHEH